MNELLSTIIEISTYSIVIYCMIMIFKKCLGKRVSVTVNYLVWGLLIIRLLVPVTMQSDIKLFTIPADVSSEALPAIINNNTNNGTAFTPNINVLNTANQNNVSAINNTPVTNQRAKAAETLQPAAQRITIPWQNIVIYIWLWGVLISILYVLQFRIRLMRKIRKSIRFTNPALKGLVDEYKSKLNIKAGIDVIVQSHLTSPCILASLKPKLIFPASSLSELDDLQIELAVKHELMHYKRRDHIVCLLMIILRCVYWFNPVVWLAQKQIQSDMETACDHSVINGLGINDKLQYASAILGIAGRKNQMVLGMALDNNKRIAERRIRGMAAKSKTGIGMRLVSLVVVLLIGFTCFTTACQPNPEKPAVVNKNDSIVSKIESNDNSNPEEIKLNSETWTESYTLQDIANININAEVVSPSKPLPVAELSFKPFLSKDIENIATAVFDAPKFYAETDYPAAKEDIQATIIEQKRYLAEETEEFMKNKIQNDINYYEDLYNQIPDNYTPKTVPVEFKKVEYEPNSDDIHLTIKSNNNFWSLNAYKTSNNFCRMEIMQMTGYNSRGWYNNISISTINALNTTEEQAVEQAKKIAKDIGCDLTFALAHGADTPTLNSKFAWAIEFTREINGIQTTFDGQEIGGDISKDYAEAPIPYEILTVYIDDDGFAGLKWSTPMEVKQIVSDNTKILPFDDTKETIKTQLTRVLAQDIENAKKYDEITGVNVDVTNATLGLMRIKDKDNKYLLVPVWDIYLNTQYVRTEEAEKEAREVKGEDYSNPYAKYGEPLKPGMYSRITINAIDGSVIQRDLGH